MKLAKTIVLKPTLACNLRCRYCYEFCRNGDRYVADRFRVEEVEALIERTARLFPESRVLWMLHGGEPLLNGLNFFRRVVECIRRVNHKFKVTFMVALQTNATLLTDEWIKILEDNADLLSERIVSVSIDGPREINDQARVTADGASAYEMTLATIERIRKSELNFTTISVVGSHNVDRPDEVYRFIRDLDANFNKFIPCYNFDAFGNAEKLGIMPMAYATFMCRVFDLWIHDLPRYATRKWPVIDPIATIVSTLTETFVTWCEYRDEKCDNFVAIYPNGEMWLCDTFDQSTMRDAGFLGNVRDLTDEALIRAFTQPCQLCKYEEFYRTFTQSCNACSIREFCHGGCIVNRASLKRRSIQLFANYCEAKRMLFQHIREGVGLALS